MTILKSRVRLSTHFDKENKTHQFGLVWVTCITDTWGMPRGQPKPHQSPIRKRLLRRSLDYLPYSSLHKNLIFEHTYLISWISGLGLDLRNLGLPAGAGFSPGIPKMCFPHLSSTPRHSQNCFSSSFLGKMRKSNFGNPCPAPGTCFIEGMGLGPRAGAGFKPRHPQNCFSSF